MELHRHKIITLLLKIVFKLPALFPCCLLSHSDSLAYRHDETSSEFYKRDIAYTKASLLDKPFHIKAVSIVLKN